MDASFVMTSRWWLDADPQRVWPLVGDCRHWPRWLQSMQEQREALHWRMPWPWASSFEVQDGQCAMPHHQDQWLIGPVRVRCDALVETQPVDRVAVTLRLQLSLDRPWLRHTAPSLLPWVARQHFIAMQQSVPRLGELLNCPVSLPSRWAGYRAR
ncbi:MAG: hypothetical protein IIA03_12420 [Proteobacteria bacterium]|jgi:hypothetical protein|nr:hypothetical protein [Methylibium sp.]MBY0367226.1 hypothetical protein [Burkholderiaceae bacterium]MCH8857013.1 hypothetical protein [Pseudomonadota bacterium]|mmetsp:Transcript_23355/g.55443  ORF Transcript_23355/g.55443 Transcript_23355/m.55443 type:complete len:155 (+) Transcript_23355:655-1119(+)